MDPYIPSPIAWNLFARTNFQTTNREMNSLVRKLKTSVLNTLELSDFFHSSAHFDSVLQP